MRPELTANLNSMFGANLVERACEPEINDGWYDLTVIALKAIIKAVPNIQVAIIKEKFGTLTIQCNWPETESRSDEKAAFAVINFASHISSTICEVCANRAKIRTSGYWWRTLCDSCYSEARTAEREAVAEMRAMHEETSE